MQSERILELSQLLIQEVLMKMTMYLDLDQNRYKWPQIPVDFGAYY